MNQVVNSQTLLFLTCIEIGIIMGMFYDLIRIFRKIIPHPNWLIQVEDTLYWVSGALIGFAILYMHNYGKIRFFVFLGMLLGGVLYLCTLSIIFMKFATWLIDLMKQIIDYILHILGIPIKWIIHLIKIPLKAFQRLLLHLNTYRRRQTKKLSRKIYYQKSDVRSQLKYSKTKWFTTLSKHIKIRLYD